MASINVKFAQSFSFQLEGSFAQLSVVRDSTSTYSGAFSVDYSCTAITATSGVDFGSVSGTLNFSSSENLKYIQIPIYNDSSTDPLESFIVILSNLQASGATSSSITTSAHSVYIVDTAPSAPEPSETPTETQTLTHTASQTTTLTETSTHTASETSTDTETQTLIHITPTETRTLTHTATESKTSSLVPIVFPSPTPEPINPYPTCWCTPSGTTCPPRPRPSPTPTPTYMILPPNAPDYVIVDGRCYKKTTDSVNTKKLNYNYAGNYEGCEDCNESLFKISDPAPTPGSEYANNPPLGTDSIYQKYVLASVFNDRYWQSIDQNSNLIYGNLLYNKEPVYGASIFVYNKDGNLISQGFSSSSSSFNLVIEHNPQEHYSVTFQHEKFNQYNFSSEIIFHLPGQKFSMGDIDVKDV